ncbi:MAG: hypothetical protein ACI8RZ_000059 [Myxococcota bacterium]|jgi:hypothetical protein
MSARSSGSASHSLSASTVQKLPSLPASGRWLSPTLPENLACRVSDTALCGSPCARPGGLRLETRRSKQYNQQIWGVRQPPDRLRMPHPVPAPPPAGQLARLRPAAAPTHRSGHSQPPDRLRLNSEHQLPPRTGQRHLEQQNRRARVTSLREVRQRSQRMCEGLGLLQPWGLREQRGSRRQEARVDRRAG